MVFPGKAMLFLSVLFCLSVQTDLSGTIPEAPRTTALLLELMQSGHYAGTERLADSDFSDDVRRRFLVSLDPRGLILLEGDVDDLMDMSVRLERPDVALVHFLDQTTRLYSRRLLEARALVRESNTAFEAAAGRSVVLYNIADPEYPDDDSERQRRWQAYIRFQMLNRAYAVLLPSAYSEFETYVNANREALWQAVSHSEIALLDAVRNHPDGFEEFVLTMFYNAIATQFDPHSAFFTQRDKDNLEAMLSADAYSFGMILEQDVFGGLIVRRLIPGGPAWKSGRINKGDFILEVTFPDEQRSIPAMDLNPFQLEELITARRSNKIRLKVRKPDGLIEIVTLYREKLTVEENIISSFILEGHRRIGYIYMPAFYTEWEKAGAPGSANDVAREILKLKQERIEGLILDLRDNGGGSLQEAADLAGIFIDEGPLFLAQDNRGRVDLIKDPNRGVIYRDPLLVLVNGNSASASEFFAQAIQDYRRGVVAGSATFGKATSQIVLPLQRSRAEVTQYVKLTTHMYFGLDGRTHQGRGVRPDFTLGDSDGLAEREERLLNYLEPHSVERNVSYDPWPLVALDDARNASRDRQARSAGFETVGDLTSELKDRMEDLDEVDLELHAFFDTLHPLQVLAEKYRTAAYRSQDIYRVRNHAHEQRIESMDDHRRELNSERRSVIAEDIYIQESYFILNDCIAL